MDELSKLEGKLKELQMKTKNEDVARLAKLVEEALCHVRWELQGLKSSDD